MPKSKSTHRNKHKEDEEIPTLETFMTLKQVPKITRGFINRSFRVGVEKPIAITGVRAPRRSI